MFSLNLLNLVTKIVFVKKGSNLSPLVYETKMLPHPNNQQDTGSREDLYIEPNSYFSDLSDSLNSLNSLNF